MGELAEHEQLQNDGPWPLSSGTIFEHSYCTFYLDCLLCPI